jgi:putative transposase
MCLARTVIKRQAEPLDISRGTVYYLPTQELAHRVATTLEACHAKDALEEAFKRFGRPEIVNTDQGSQFTAQEFTKTVLDAGCQLSMDGKGAWRDNVFIERIWRSAKYEGIYVRAYSTVGEARKDIADYFKWYNAGRPHSSSNRQAPNDVYFNELAPLKRAA